MFSRNGILIVVALVLLAVVCHAATRSDADGDRTATRAVTADANGENTASIPDFDGDGTIGFGDFVIFAGVFGARQGDEKYEAKYDLNGDGEIGFSDFVIFAQNFGKEAPSPVVAIPDANLRTAIESALNKDSGAPITEAEMATLDSLAASDAEITDLTGLEYAVNLTYLSLNDNDITDVSALAKLTSLTQLWLSNNSIDDVSALSKLTNLTELWLWNNRIEDISPLSGLTNLTRLSLGRNNVTDVSALAGLTNLKTIILTGNDISDLAPLVANKGLGAGGTVDVTDNPLNAASESTYIPTLQARGVSVSFVPSPAVAIPDPNLRAAIAAALGKERAAPITHAEIKTLNRLEANDSGISDLTGLEFATNLSYLNLSSWSSDDLPDNNISDVSPLTGLTDLTTLLIGGNNVSDLSPLSKLTNLTELWLESNSISVVSHLSGLPNLKELSLSDNNISDVSPLTGLTDLTTLLIGGNNVSDLSPLSRLTNLTELILNTNNIANISALAKLTNLDRLFLSQNSIEDISALSKLTNLIELWLGHNQIEDISALSGLTRLTYLTLNANNIMNISALAKLTSLTRLLLGNNSIEDISALSKLTNLIELWLGFNQIKDISALSDLTNLKMLILTDNDVSDLTPLASNTGLGSGDTVNLVRNPLDVASTNIDIPALRARGVYVSFDEVIDITEPQIHNDNMLVLPVADNLAALWTHSGNPPPLEEYAARFYKHFNDEFDFLIFLPNVLFHQLEPEAIHGAFHVKVKNHTKGIGVPIFADNSRWASAERLQGVVFHNYIDPSMFRGLLLHELMHQWGNYVVPITSFPYGAHWGFSTSGGYLDCYDISNWIDHGDGKYSAPDPIYFRSSEQYSPIELYLAGFIPPEDVPAFQVAEDGKWLPDERGDIVKDDNGYRMFTASGFKTYTIEDIIAKHGRRDPNQVQSQKDFRAAVILLIGEDYPATREILESLSDDVSWFSHAGKDESGPPVTNFYEATGGRATITMDGLSQFVRSSGSKIALPISFGTPHRPS